MNKEREMISKKNVINAIIFFLVGLVLLMGSNQILTILAYIIGGCIILYGIIEVVTSLRIKKQIGSIPTSNLLLSIILVALGGLLIIYPVIVNAIIRLLFGGWILFAGINRLVLAFTIKLVDNKGAKVFLVSALVMILIGIFVVVNLFEILGILIMIYAICEVIDYIFYKSSNKDYSKSNFNETAPGRLESNKDNEGSLKKKSKNKKIIEAKIEEPKKSK